MGSNRVDTSRVFFLPNQLWNGIREQVRNQVIDPLYDQLGEHMVDQ